MAADPKLFEPALQAAWSLMTWLQRPTECVGHESRHSLARSSAKADCAQATARAHKKRVSLTDTGADVFARSYMLSFKMLDLLAACATLRVRWPRPGCALQPEQC